MPKFNNKLDPPPYAPEGRYIMFRELANVVAISFDASIRRNCTNPSPALSRAFIILSAASASPSARITAACFSCSAFLKKNF